MEHIRKTTQPMDSTSQAGGYLLSMARARLLMLSARDSIASTSSLSGFIFKGENWGVIPRFVPFGMLSPPPDCMVKRTN